MTAAIVIVLCLAAFFGTVWVTSIRAWRRRNRNYNAGLWS